MTNFNLEDYEPVAERIKKFYADHKDGRILTEITHDDGTRAIIKASLYKSDADTVWATGYAEELRGEGFVNKTSHIENAETSAIGRALANANYAGDKRPSREEMAKTERPVPKATDKQLDYAKSLLEKAGYSSEAITKRIESIESMMEAKTLIDSLIKQGERNV